MYHTVECLNSSGDWDVCVINGEWISGTRMYWPPKPELYKKFIHKTIISEEEKREIENWASYKFKLVKSYGEF